LPAYLCSAEIAEREQRWHEVLNLTSRALELDPSNDAYAYFFSAIAYFNLNQLPEAEERALKAEEIDKEHDQPLLQFLLAQIYEAKQDSTAAAVHFRECRKLGAGFKQPEEGIIRSAKPKVDSPRQLSARVQHEPRLAMLQVRDNSQFAVSCAVHCGPPLGSAMEG
jgi:tetratricopeptide (TPR) repeat protein